jgi:hypothetical protein
MSASEKTAARVGYDTFGGLPEDWDAANDRFWKRITDAVIAHARPQIERDARAAAISDAASALRGDPNAVRFGYEHAERESAASLVESLATAPPGYVCVPVEPTADMLTAGEGCQWPERDIYGILDTLDCRKAAEEIYKAMLASRPK